jgi:hypothetical protein
MLADQHGVLRQQTGLPNDPGFVGVQLGFQFLVFDPQATTVLPYVVSNAIKFTLQP